MYTDKRRRLYVLYVGRNGIVNPHSNVITGRATIPVKSTFANGARQCLSRKETSRNTRKKRIIRNKTVEEEQGI